MPQYCSYSIQVCNVGENECSNNFQIFMLWYNVIHANGYSACTFGRAGTGLATFGLSKCTLIRKLVWIDPFSDDGNTGNYTWYSLKIDSKNSIFKFKLLKNQKMSILALLINRYIRKLKFEVSSPLSSFCWNICQKLPFKMQLIFFNNHRSLN